MSAQPSNQKVADESISQMQGAVKRRKKAKRALQKVRPSSRKVLKTTDSREDSWKELQPLQLELLEAELDVIRIAASGQLISDFPSRCKEQTKEAWRDDIAVEADKMFSLLSPPMRSIRARLRTANLSNDQRLSGRRKLIKVLSAPLKTMFSMGDELAFAFLRCLLEKRSEKRIRIGLARVVMYISDCLRYSLDFDKSNEAVAFMHALNPEDPEAHMRLALNFAMLDNDDEAIRTFFHYCVFLANRKVPVDHDEAVVVKNFVKKPDSVHQNRGIRKETINAPKAEFYRSLISTLWTVLSEDFQTASTKVHNAFFWKLLSAHLEHSSNRENMHHMVGALVFVHHRTSPRGTPEKKLLPERELIDFIIGQIIRVTAEEVTTKLRALHGIVQSRKKNRLRAAQKKRKAKGEPANKDCRTAIGFDIFKTMVNMDTAAPLFGSLAFLSQYWSLARSAAAPNCDFEKFARILKALSRLHAELESIEQVTCVSRLACHIMTKVCEADARDLIPALPEDLKFHALLPCKEREIFCHTCVPPAPVPSILREQKDGMLRAAFKAMKDESYESLAAQTARRHLEAFSQQCAKEAAQDGPVLDRESASQVVATTIRKFRLKRLITDLEKVGGGTCKVIAQEPTPDEPANIQPIDSHDLPPPEQPCATLVHNDSLHQHMSPRQVGARLRKRRRVIGTCTLPVHIASPTSSPSNASSADKSPTPNRDAAPLPLHWHGSDGVAALPVLGAPLTATASDSTRRPQHRSPLDLWGRGLLSQGSMHLVYAQIPDETRVREQEQEERRNPTETADLSAILRDVLYPQEGVESPPWWRTSPSQEFAQVVYQNGASVGDG